MWVTVIKKFRDKTTGEIYPVGKRLNIKPERAAEILSAGNLIKKDEKTDKETKSATE